MPKPRRRHNFLRRFGTSIPSHLTKTNLSTLVINIATAVGLALILELVLATGLHNPGFIPGSMLPVFRNLYLEDRNILQVTDCAEYDPELFYRFKPGKCIFTNQEFESLNEINSAGLRDDEASLTNPSILVFGDSFTMGWGVSQEKCYPQILERMSGQRVLNAGISSFGTAREMKLLRKLGYGHINTVIIQYHSNDYPENLTSIENDYKLPIRPKEAYEELKKSISDRNQYTPFKYLKRMSKTFALSIMKKEEPQNDTLEAEAFLKVIANSDLLRVAGKVVLFRVDDGLNDNGFVDAVDHLLHDARFSKLKITTVRLSGVMTPEDYFILDEHLKARGHEKLAAKLKDVVGPEASPVIVSNPPAIPVSTRSLRGR